MNDLKVSDIMCKWYIWVAVGYVIGKNLSDTLGDLLVWQLGVLQAVTYKKIIVKKMIDNFQLAS